MKKIDFIIMNKGNSVELIELGISILFTLFYLLFRIFLSRPVFGDCQIK